MLTNGTLKAYGKSGSSVIHILQLSFEDSLTNPVCVRLSPSNPLNDTKCKFPDCTHRQFRFSSVLSDSLWPHGLQHARLPCPSPTPGVYSNSCPLNWWCHPTISSCHPLLLPPSIFPSTRVFLNESVLCIRRPKFQSFSISPSSEYSGLTAFRMDWLGLVAVQGTLKSLLQYPVQKHQFFGVQLSL